MEQQKTKESKKRYFAYDLMRAAAMLLIVFYHMNCEWSARLMESSLVVTKIGAHSTRSSYDKIQSEAWQPHA